LGNERKDGPVDIARCCGRLRPPMQAQTADGRVVRTIGVGESSNDLAELERDVRPGNLGFFHDFSGLKQLFSIPHRGR